MMAPPLIDVYWSFRSPYCYLALDRLLALRDDIGATIAIKHVWPAADQPHIGRLTRMGVLAVEAGMGLPFLDHVMRLLWNGRIDGWDQGAHLANAVADAGLDFQDLISRQETEIARLDKAIATNAETLTDAGHWGVPTVVYDGEPFFGQNRLDLLIWRIGQSR